MRDLRNVSVKILDFGILIRWEALSLIGLVTIYVSTDAAASPTAGTKIAQVPLINGQYMWNQAKDGVRYYFWLLPENGRPVQVAQRMLPLQGVNNFRDLGGYPTVDGCYIRWGMLYRSGAHDRMTKQDERMLRQLGVRTVIDYRSPKEKAACLDKQIDGVHYLDLPVLAEAEVATVMDMHNIRSGADARTFLRFMNKLPVHQRQAQQAYAAMLRVCLQPDQMPMVQHSATGKDRVGVGVAILLLLLGVDEEIVLDDYLLSKASSVLPKGDNPVKNKIFANLERSLAPLLDMLQFEYLSIFIDEMKSHYGTAEQYALKALGITKDEIAQLRKLYLLK